MKLKSAVAVILIILMTPGLTLAKEDEPLLLEALKSAGASPEIMDIVDWSVINSEFMDFSQMKEQRDAILDIFDAKGKIYEETKENGKTYRILNTKVLLESDTFLQIILQSMNLPEEYELEPQTYLVVSVSGKKLDKFSDCAQKVQAAVVAFSGESKIASCLTGSFNGKLDEAKQQQVLENIKGFLKISNQVKLNDEYAFSFMGYSPLLKNGIQILDKTYNVHIAMRYNSDDDKTYIWIGSPVISLDY